MNPLDTQPDHTSGPFNHSQYPQLNSDNPLSPKGRFTRLSFLAWNGVIAFIFTLIFFIIFIIGVAGAAFASFSGSYVFTHPLVIIAIILALIAYIGMVVAMVCLNIRRLHDLNKSGWLWLIYLIPIVSFFFAIYIFVARGSKETNNYGPFRPTEIAEKYIGIAYAIFLGLFIALYSVILSFALIQPDQLIETILKSESVLMTNADLSIEDNLETDTDQEQKTISSNEEETEASISEANTTQTEHQHE